MSDQQSSEPSQSMTIQLEILPEDEQEGDIADIDEIGRSLFEELRSNGYTVTPASTGRKGGEPILDILVQIPHFIHDNRELLLAIFDSLSLTLQCLLLARDRRAEREKAHRDPLKFTLEVNGKPVAIEVPDAETGVKLLEKFQDAHPEEAKKVTPQSKVKIGVKAPKKKRRRSR